MARVKLLPSSNRKRRYTMATEADKAAFHPQPRTFAPSKEDVLQNLQYCARLPQTHHDRLLACVREPN